MFLFPVLFCLIWQSSGSQTVAAAVYLMCSLPPTDLTAVKLIVRPGEGSLKSGKRFPGSSRRLQASFRESSEFFRKGFWESVKGSWECLIIQRLQGPLKEIIQGNFELGIKESLNIFSKVISRSLFHNVSGVQRLHPNRPTVLKRGLNDAWVNSLEIQVSTTLRLPLLL